MVKAFKDTLVFLAEKRTVSQQLEDSVADPNLDISFDEEVLLNEVDEYDREEAELNNVFGRRISCYAHNMMLAVRTAVERNFEVNQSLKVAFDLISKMTKSGKAVEMLRQQSGLALLKVARTRWIYWYYVLERLLKLKKSVCEVAEELDIANKVTSLEWKQLQALRDLLEPFADFVRQLEGESYATISQVYPSLYELIDRLEKFLNTTRIQPAVDVAVKIREELKSRFAHVTMPYHASFDAIYIAATLLDPRFALLLEGELLNKAILELQRLDELVNSDSGTINSTHPDELRTGSSLAETVSCGMFSAVYHKIEEKRRKKSDCGAAQSSVVEECTAYLEDICKEVETPFDFWKGKKDRFPKLYSLAVDILSVPATSAPVERVFSCAGIVLDKNRHNLSNQHLEMEVMVRFNKEYLDL